MEVTLLYLIQAIRIENQYSRGTKEVKFTIAFQDLESALAYKRRIDAVKEKAMKMYSDLRSNYIPIEGRSRKTDWSSIDWHQKKLEWKRYTYEIKIVELRTSSKP